MFTLDVYKRTITVKNDDETEEKVYKIMNCTLIELIVNGYSVDKEVSDKYRDYIFLSHGEQELVAIKR